MLLQCHKASSTRCLSKTKACITWRCGAPVSDQLMAVSHHLFLLSRQPVASSDPFCRLSQSTSVSRQGGSLAQLPCQPVQRAQPGSVICSSVALMNSTPLVSRSLPVTCSDLKLQSYSSKRKLPTAILWRI